MKSIPQNLITPLHDRIFGDKMGDLPLPLVDEGISALAQPTAAFGEKREWQSIEANLSAFAGREVTLRLYQNLLAANRLRPPSVAHWKSIVLQ